MRCVEQRPQQAIKEQEADESMADIRREVDAMPEGCRQPCCGGRESRCGAVSDGRRCQRDEGHQGSHRHDTWSTSKAWAWAQTPPEVVADEAPPLRPREG